MLNRTPGLDLVPIEHNDYHPTVLLSALKFQQYPVIQDRIILALLFLGEGQCCFASSYGNGSNEMLGYQRENGSDRVTRGERTIQGI